MKNTLNLTSEQIKELEELKEHPVDYSDIPETTDFSKAEFRFCGKTFRKKDSEEIQQTGERKESRF